MDSPEDKRIQGLICEYALRKAQHGVYKTQLYSISAGAPVLLVVAIGENALALDRAIMAAAVPEPGAIEVVKGF